MTTAARTPKRLVPSDDPNAYARWVRRQRAYGRWEPFTDATPARDHFLNIMAVTGSGWRQLADEAGVPRSTISYLIYGSNGRRATRITPDNARRILGLTADCTRAATIPSAGTRRRLQVLIGEGWPQIHLAPQIGTHLRYVNAILKVRLVTHSTAGAVADAYERLRDTDPLTFGVTTQGVRIAQRIAARGGWPDRLWWEDYGHIDDPLFDPATFEQGLKRDELAAIRRRDIIHLTQYGYDPKTIHKRLEASGHEITLSTVKGIVTEHRTGARRDRSKRAVA